MLDNLKKILKIHIGKKSFQTTVQSKKFSSKIVLHSIKNTLGGHYIDLCCEH